MWAMQIRDEHSAESGLGRGPCEARQLEMDPR